MLQAKLSRRSHHAPHPPVLLMRWIQLFYFLMILIQLVLVLKKLETTCLDKASRTLLISEVSVLKNVEVPNLHSIDIGFMWLESFGLLNDSF